MFHDMLSSVLANQPLRCDGLHFDIVSFREDIAFLFVRQVFVLIGLSNTLYDLNNY